MIRRGVPTLLILLVVSTGCLAPGNPATTPSETPLGPDTTDNPIATATTGPTDASTVTGSPTEILPEVPKPRNNCTVQSLPNGTYPSLPDEITEGSANDFALEFEETYAWEELADEETDVSGFDGTWTETVQWTDTGYVVKTTVRLDYVYESDNTAIPGSTTSHGWYYVTDQFAVRAPSSAETIPESGWETIACT